jgi:phospholipid-transporting ATPase
LLPLLFVISISAIKDLFEDLGRHRSDSEENNRKVLVADPKTGVFTLKIWKFLRVGEILKITKN